MPTILPDLPQAEAAIIEMTNTYRARNKLGTVTRSPELQAAARAYADYLASTNAFAHDADGHSHAERARAAGYDYCEVSENLARSLDSRGFETRALARTTVEGWLNSPGHRHNIEAANVTDIGVAIARVPDKYPKYVAVQMFGRPRSLSFDIQVANTTKGNVTYVFGEHRHELPPSMAATHTVCVPTSLVFESAEPGKGVKATTLHARYQAQSGKVFVVAPGRGGKPEVRVEERRQVE